jgi:glycosyltransferase involved in cell wall biosynthesis
MRILQVVKLLSPDGAYGGPARVAVNQCAELARRGHAVTLAAAVRGFEELPTETQGVRLQAFPARTVIPATGVAGVGAVGLSRWFRQHRDHFDIVHVHLARELVVMPLAAAARRLRLPYVVQTHGMVRPTQHPFAPIVDAGWTRRVLRDAGAVLYLTVQEREQLREVALAPLRLTQLGNGVPDYPAARSTAPPEVVFLARLHERKRPVDFVRMAIALLDSGVDAWFTLIGPDDGEAARVLEAIGDRPRIRWQGPIAPIAVADRLAAASIYVLPAVQEPYPMAVLEAMSVGLPVVVCDDCGLAPLIAETGSGLVSAPTMAALTAAVGALLADSSAAAEMGHRGRRTVRGELSMNAIGDRLLETYTAVLYGAR